MTGPEVVATGGVSQAFTPAVPVIVHTGVPVGAAAPVGPVTVNVNTALPCKVPSPAPVKTAVGVTLATLTVVGEVAASAL